MTPHFVRMNYAAQAELDQMTATRSLAGREKWLTVTLRPGDFVLAARFNEATLTGDVRLVGQVRVSNGRLEIDWKPAQFSLHPTGNGIPKWRSMPSFNMKGDVARRYDLDGKCRALFPAAADSVEQLRTTPGGELETSSTPAPDPGYIYVIKSDYGYKIGKSRNLKDRARLFSVRLPFLISVDISGWSPTYSAKERELHRRFAHRRLEGEWFALTPEDLEQLRTEIEGDGSPRLHQVNAGSGSRRGRAAPPSSGHLPGQA